MNRVLGAVWYSPFTRNLDVIGIVRVDTGFEIKYYIGTAKGENEEEDIQNILKFGSRFHPEIFERWKYEIKN